MNNRLNWFPIGNKLVNFLQSFRYSDGTRLFDKLTDRDDMVIKFGSGNFGEYPALWVLFGSEEDIKKQDKIVGNNIEFWIDIFVKGEASPDADFDNWLYKQAYEVERELDNALRIFNKLLHKDYNLATNLVIKEVLSDGDNNAPAVVNHRVILNIEWYS